jgi:hypothetical protein
MTTSVNVSRSKQSTLARSTAVCFNDTQPLTNFPRVLLPLR